MSAKPAAPFDDELSGYTTAARAYLGSPGGERPSGMRALRTDWALYTAAAGSALGLASAAEASVIYSGLQNVTLVRGGTGGAYDRQSTLIDIDGAGPDEMLLRLTYSGGLSAGYAAARAYTSVGFVINGNNQPRRMSSGSSIGTSQARRADFFGRFRDLNGGVNIAGTWPGGYPTSSVGFAGISFAAAGETHFGWLRLRIRNDSNGLPDKLTLVDWAYETTDGAPIQAGAGAPIPEPSSFALLATGAAGLAAYRRRQRARA